jgi:hypothetical protein
MIRKRGILKVDKSCGQQYNSDINFELTKQEAENMYKHPNICVIASICAADL